MHTFEIVSAGLFNANGGEWKGYILLSSSPSSTSGNVIQVDLLRIVASAAQWTGFNEMMFLSMLSASFELLR